MLKPDRYPPYSLKLLTKNMFDFQEKLDAAVLTLSAVKDCPHCVGCRHAAEAALGLIQEPEDEKQSNS